MRILVFAAVSLCLPCFGQLPATAEAKLAEPAQAQKWPTCQPSPAV